MPASAQSLTYHPERGQPYRYRTTNRLSVSQTILDREQHYTLSSNGTVLLTLLDPGPRLLWRLGFEELDLAIEGAFPTPRRDALRGTVVTVSTTPTGVVLDARASGIVPPGFGVRYLERAASSFLPQLPDGSGGVNGVWSDTLTVTEVLRGVTTEIEMVVNYAVSDTAALAGGPVVPVEYTGTLLVRGTGTISGARVSVTGEGEVTGNFLYDPADGIFRLHERRQLLESTLTLQGPDGGLAEIPSRQILESRAERF